MTAIIYGSHKNRPFKPTYTYLNVIV